MGAFGDDDGGTNAGAALIYTGSAQDGWALKQKLTGNLPGGEYGISVATNSNGTILMMGGPSDNDGINIGAALVYSNINKPPIEIKFKSGS
jgi:hypothetical protein